MLVYTKLYTTWHECNFESHDENALYVQHKQTGCLSFVMADRGNGGTRGGGSPSKKGE